MRITIEKEIELTLCFGRSGEAKHECYVCKSLGTENSPVILTERIPTCFKCLKAILSNVNLEMLKK